MSETQNEVDHKSLAAEYFNETWKLLDKKDRSDAEKELMIHLAHASLIHWMKVPDHSKTNLSVGYWQISRVYATCKETANALKYANICLHISLDESVSAYYEAYAHEAMARAWTQLGDRKHAAMHLNKIQEFLPKIEEKSAKYLLADMKDILDRLQV